jgi:hypothetical protein
MIAALQRPPVRGELTMSDMASFDLNAASWRHGHADEHAFVEALAERLTKSLPDLVTVERDHKMFAKTHNITRIQVTFSGETFSLSHQSGRYVAQKAKSVHGVVLSTKQLNMKEWLDELSTELSNYAREHESERESLEDFLL